MLQKRKYVGLLFVSSIFFLTPLFSHATTAQELTSRYADGVKTGQKVNILIVPGHDEEYWGTEFNDIHEADITVAIAQFLYNDLKKDPRLNVTITRTQMGYADTFKNYFETHRQDIVEFIASSTAAFKQQISAGTKSQNEIVPHATAKPEVAIRLYGINKWANENNIDITLHLHVNDQGGRRWGVAGEYTGIAIYIPQNQFSNAGASAVVGTSRF